MTNKKLFSDKIYAFEWGPVVESVREAFKGFRYINQNDVEMITGEKSLRMPIRSKILFAEFGSGKLFSVDRTLDKYGNFTESQLIQFTHRSGTPWDTVYDGSYFKLIPDKIIKEKHFVEEI